MLEGGSEDVKRSQEVNVYHSFESARRHVESPCWKIPSRTRDDDIDQAISFAGSRQCRLHRGVVPYIRGHSQRSTAGSDNTVCGSGDLIFGAADDCKPSPGLAEAVRNPEVNPTTSSGHESDFVGESHRWKSQSRTKMIVQARIG
jgi:hypothetical protein